MSTERSRATASPPLRSSPPNAIQHWFLGAREMIRQDSGSRQKRNPTGTAYVHRHIPSRLGFSTLNEYQKNPRFGAQPWAPILPELRHAEPPPWLWEGLKDKIDWLPASSLLCGRAHGFPTASERVSSRSGCSVAARFHQGLAWICSLRSEARFRHFRALAPGQGCRRSSMSL